MQTAQLLVLFQPDSVPDLQCAGPLNVKPGAASRKGCRQSAKKLTLRLLGLISGEAAEALLGLSCNLVLQTKDFECQYVFLFTTRGLM